MSDQSQAEQLLESCTRPDARDRFRRRSVSRDETGIPIQRQRSKRRYSQHAQTVWSSEFRNVIALRGTLSDGRQVSVAGTLTGPKQVEKIVGIDGLDLEIALSDHMLVLRYTDRPGVIGALGRVLGEAGVNIAAMQVGRDVAGGQAVSVLTLDSVPPASSIDDVAREIGAQSAHLVDLSD